jgi:orotidine-5'-phosphate decarboxylase
MATTRAVALRRLAVALDLSERDAIVGMARSLIGHCGIVKLGLEAFTAHGPALVREVAALGMPVFLDLKLHDIPNTVERAARNAAALGAAMVTVHASGGEAMLRAAVAGVRAGARNNEKPPAVLAVTVLTSLDDAALEQLGVPGGAAGRVRAWAELAQRAGCGGVICSPLEGRAASGARSRLPSRHARDPSCGRGCGRSTPGGNPGRSRRRRRGHPRRGPSGHRRRRPRGRRGGDRGRALCLVTVRPAQAARPLTRLLESLARASHRPTSRAGGDADDDGRT